MLETTDTHFHWTPERRVAEFRIAGLELKHRILTFRILNSKTTPASEYKKMLGIPMFSAS